MSSGRSTPAQPIFPPVGLGCGTLGDPDEVISEQAAQATLEAAWAGGVRYFDTAPWYGNTKSEHRVGHFLQGRPREQFLLSTKVGRVYFRPRDELSFRNSDYGKRWTGGLPFDLRFDYTNEGILRSYEDSLMRLGLNRVDALVIHDLDPRHQRSEAAVERRLDELDAGRGFQALADLKSAGEIKLIGAGINMLGMIPRFLDRFEIDFFLVAMPYTLLDQSALDGEFQLCAAHGASIVVGAVFASGILAADSPAGQNYGYKPADNTIVERVARIRKVCTRHQVRLPAAALQFPLAHPLVTSVIPGANSAQQVRCNLRDLETPIPDAFWRDLKEAGLLRADAPVPVRPFHVPQFQGETLPK